MSYANAFRVAVSAMPFPSPRQLPLRITTVTPGVPFSSPAPLVVSVFATFGMLAAIRVYDPFQNSPTFALATVRVYLFSRSKR